MTDGRDLSRREFIAGSASSLLLASRGATAAEAPWYARMRRCGQINFNERDPLGMDCEAWADYGSPRRHNESTWLYKTCMFSPYFNEQMPAIYREINRLYTVDGFFTNGWPSTGALGVCHCGSCRKVHEAAGAGFAR